MRDTDSMESGHGVWLALQKMIAMRQRSDERPQEIAAEFVDTAPATHIEPGGRMRPDQLPLF